MRHYRTLNLEVNYRGLYLSIFQYEGRSHALNTWTIEKLPTDFLELADAILRPKDSATYLPLGEFKHGHVEGSLIALDSGMIRLWFETNDLYSPKEIVLRPEELRTLIAKIRGYFR